MKKQSINLFEPISRTAMSQFVKDVKEIICRKAELELHKIFSSADLWNIQRNKKTSRGRKFLV